MADKDWDEISRKLSSDLGYEVQIQPLIVPSDPICPCCEEPCEADGVDKSVCCGARLWGSDYKNFLKTLSPNLEEPSDEVRRSEQAGNR